MVIHAAGPGRRVACGERVLGTPLDRVLGILVSSVGRLFVVSSTSPGLREHARERLLHRPRRAIQPEATTLCKQVRTHDRHFTFVSRCHRQAGGPALRKETDEQTRCRKSASGKTKTPPEARASGASRVSSSSASGASALSTSPGPIHRPAPVIHARCEILVRSYRIPDRVPSKSASLIPAEMGSRAASAPTAADGVGDAARGCGIAAGRVPGSLLSVVGAFESLTLAGAAVAPSEVITVGAPGMVDPEEWALQRCSGRQCRLDHPGCHDSPCHRSGSFDSP